MLGSENVNGGCRMTAWREGSETGPKLNLSMSNQFCVRDAMEESDFMDSFPNVQIFLFFCARVLYMGPNWAQNGPEYGSQYRSQYGSILDPHMDQIWDPNLGPNLTLSRAQI